MDNEWTYDELIKLGNKALIIIISDNENGLNHFYQFLDDYKNGGRSNLSREDYINYILEMRFPK